MDAIKYIWMLAGGGALDRNSDDRVTRASKEKVWTQLSVRLPIKKVFLHTSNAICYLARAVDSGLLAAAAN
eukprot:6779279-Pyramimonas_sp.AAC.1